MSDEDLAPAGQARWSRTAGEIHKSADERARSNLPDYDSAAADLGWDAYRNWLDYLPDGALNIAYEAVDRHVANGWAAAKRFAGSAAAVHGAASATQT